MFKRVGILGHPKRPETGEISDYIAQTLNAHGIDTWQRIVWEADTVMPLMRDSDMVVAIGGDGAMLRAGRLGGLVSVPILGVNAGHLGFLTEVSPQHWDTALVSLLHNDYWIEQRMMISAQVWRGDDCLNTSEALNDVVIGRDCGAQLAMLETYIDGDWTTTYIADALIVATPTGSTAYALAVGGPIMPPELKNILVVPVAAHLTLERPLILSEGATVEIIVRDREAALTVDGVTLMSLQENDTIVVHASDYHSRFIRLRDRNYFYRSLLDRMEPRFPVVKEPSRRLPRTLLSKSDGQNRDQKPATRN